MVDHPTPVAERRQLARPAQLAARAPAPPRRGARRRTHGAPAPSRTPCRPVRRPRRGSRARDRPAGSNSSGCHPRRYSSPAVAFWRQPTWWKVSSRRMHRLEPVHSRISSRRPSRIFVRQEGIRDRGPCRTDEVDRPAADHRGHGVGVGVATDAHDRLGGRLPHAHRPRALRALGVVARRAGVLRPPAHVDVDEVDERIDHPHELEHLVDLDPHELVAAVHGHPDRDRAVVPDGVAHALERLELETRAVGERAAVAVRAPVRVRREPLRHEIAVRAVDVDDVEADVARAARGGDEVVLHPADVLARHLLRERGVLPLRPDLARRDAVAARLAVERLRTAVVELDPGERPVRVHRLDDEPEGAHVGLLPDLARDRRRLVGVARHGGVVDVDAAPAALGLDAAERRVRARLAAAEARGVGHLVEPVGQRLGPDPHGIEQDRVPGVHGLPRSSGVRAVLPDCSVSQPFLAQPPREQKALRLLAPPAPPRPPRGLARRPGRQRLAPGRAGRTRAHRDLLPSWRLRRVGSPG